MRDFLHDDAQGNPHKNQAHRDEKCMTIGDSRMLAVFHGGNVFVLGFTFDEDALFLL